MNTFPIFTTGTTLTSTGTAVTDLIPLDSAGATPRYIRVTATASGYFRVGKDTTAAVAGDMMVQPGDAVHLAVPGCLWFSFISVSGSARVTVSPLEIGSWDKRTNQWSLDLNFTRGALDPRITFTRASSATFTNSAGLVASAATNAPRFDYDPVTRQPKGLLIEEARTNLLTYSEQFDNAAWITVSNTAIPNSTTAPDGTLTADLLVPNTVSTDHYRYQSVSPVTGTNTISVYAKAAGYSWVILFGNSASNAAAWFNVSTGVVGTVSGAAATKTASIQSVGNGWYRCTLTVSAGANAASGVMVSNADGVSVFTGDGTSGIYLWGAQLEAGAFATSYIPTVAAQATRAAENAAMTGTNLSGWNNLAAGTILGVWTQFGSTSGQVALFDNTTTGQYFNILGISNNSPSVTFVKANVRSSNVTTYADFRAIQVANGLVNKAAFGYAENDFASTANGQTVVSQASGAMPVGVDIFRLGYHRDGTYLNGNLRSITYWPRRLSNAELQAVTS